MSSQGAAAGTHTQTDTQRHTRTRTHTHLLCCTSAWKAITLEEDSRDRLHTHARAHTQTHAHTNNLTHAPTRARTRARTCAHTRACTQTHKHAHTHTQTHARAHTHANSQRHDTVPHSQGQQTARLRRLVRVASGCKCKHVFCAASGCSRNPALSDRSPGFAGSRQVAGGSSVRLAGAEGAEVDRATLLSWPRYSRVSQRWHLADGYRKEPPKFVM
jgi:hypothetical protein